MHIKLLLSTTLIITIAFTTCNAANIIRKTQQSSSLTKNRSKSHGSGNTHKTAETGSVRKTEGNGNVQKIRGSGQKSTASRTNSIRKTRVNEKRRNIPENKHSTGESGHTTKESQHHTTSDSFKQHDQNSSNTQPIYIITNEKPKTQTSEIDYYEEGYIAGITATRRLARRKTTTVAPIKSTSTTTSSIEESPCLTEAQISSQDKVSVEQYAIQVQPNNGVNCEPVNRIPLMLSSTTYTESASLSTPLFTDSTSVPLAPIQEIIPYNNDY